MKDFVFYAPTEVVFGRESEEKIPAMVKKYGGSKVLVHYPCRPTRRQLV